MRIGHMVLFGALAGLAACGAGEEVGKGDAASETASAPAAGFTPPKLREGLWTMASVSDGMNTESRMCVDAAMQEQMSVLGGQMAAGACSENAVTPRVGGGYAMRSVCDMGAGGKMVSQGVVTGDLSSGYRSEMTVTTTGAAVPQMNRTVTMVSTATHGGACPAGMKAGDLETQGIKVNMLDMAAQAKAGQAGAP